MYEFIWGSGVRILSKTITVIEFDLQFSLFVLKSMLLINLKNIDGRFAFSIMAKTKYYHR